MAVQQQRRPGRNLLSEVKTSGPKLPSRVILHAVEKIGKTSFAAHAPGVIFGMGANETGLLTLIDSGELAETPYLPPFENWGDVQEAIHSLAYNEHPYKTLALDTGNSLERLCHQHVCDREYSGDWGRRGFANYNQGFDVSLKDWADLLAALDNLRAVKRMSIIMLCHTKIETFKNPEGADFDRYVPAMHKKTWEATHRWADVILFANYHTEVQKDGAKGKGLGGQQRVLHTVRHAAYDAGNRYGLPEEIEMGSTGKEAWDNFVAAMKAARKDKA